MEEKVINNLSCREITNVKKVYYIWYDNYLSIEKIKREELWRINKLNLKPDILPMLFNVDVDEWNWDESGDKTSNGGLFERQLKGFVPKLNEWAESYFNEMLRRPMCIFIETFDESVYLFGGESPRTTFTFTKSISSRNGYDLVFTCLSEESSLIVNDENFFPAPPVSGLTCEPVTINLDGTDILIADSGSIVTINLEDTDENPVIPDDVQIVGDNIKLVFPVAASAFDIDLVDRYGNAFPTKQVSANATWDLRTLTPFDFADIFLTNATGIYTSGEENAIIQAIQDWSDAGIWQKRTHIYLFTGKNAVDNSINCRYPFLNESSGQLVFSGSPTHNSNGITYSTSNFSQIRCLNRLFYPAQDVNIAIYSRSNNTPASFGATDIGPETISPVNMLMRIRQSAGQLVYGDGAANTSVVNSNSSGYFTFNSIVGTNASKVVRNGNTGTPLSVITATTNIINTSIIRMGDGTERNHAGACIGLSLTDTQMQDDYTIWQQFQTDFNGRQV